MLLLQGRAETRKETRKACAPEAKWKEKTQTPIVRFLLETQCVFLFIWPPGAFSFFSFLFFPFFFFNFFFKCARRMGKNHRKDGDPYPAQKKVCFLLNLPSTSTHTHTHTHTQKALTQKHTTTQKALTHTGTRKEEGKQKPEKEQNNQKNVAEKKFKRCARHFIWVFWKMTQKTQLARRLRRADS